MAILGIRCECAVGRGMPEHIAENVKCDSIYVCISTIQPSVAALLDIQYP